MISQEISLYPLLFQRHLIFQFRKLNCHIDKSDGLVVQYKDLRISALEIKVYTCFSFGCYDRAKDSMMNNLGAKFCIAYFISFTSSVISFSFEIVRIKMIMQQRISQSLLFFNYAVQILIKEGLQFFKGALPQSIFGSRSAPTLVLYHDIQQFFFLVLNIKEGI
ncbi:unnamed protein product [Paramecium octaurelia]|uniref:ADP/ATP translocase n=1 Tax=Paramecium octaurelia TaxID=43137 RepID=A0A8S1TMH9_PAROT|nr:unnamed protein product [Paramecium octaurelia]